MDSPIQQEKTSKFESSTTFEEIRNKIENFATERDWNQFHSPRNLALALTGEVGEVCEIFQWKDKVSDGVPELSDKEKTHLAQEISDVLIYTIRLADKCGIDLPIEVMKKIELNAKKYPVERVKGCNKKYNEYEEYDSSKTDY
ncbi:hypothetical protein WA158_003838 [Blastocystis sp. Blastoise]